MVDFYTLKMKEIYTQNYPSKNPKSHSNSLNLLKQDFEKLMKPYLAQESMEKWVGYLLNDSKEMNVSVDLASRLASLEKSERGLLEMKSMLSPLATAIDNGIYRIV